MEEQNIQQEVRRYLKLFPMLLLLTFTSVGISYLHLAMGIKITLILTIALIQGTIATSYFMHLITEKVFTRSLLFMTVIILTGMALIIYHYYDIPQGGHYVP